MKEPEKEKLRLKRLVVNPSLETKVLENPASGDL